MNKNAQQAIEWSRNPEWLTIEQFFGSSKTFKSIFKQKSNYNKILLKAQYHDMGSNAQAEWACNRCTYHNEATATVCSICQSPKD